MKIVVISDTHSDTSLMNKVLEKENDADLYIHCGDYCVPEYFMNSWRHVMGNCDWDVSVPKVLDIDSPFGLIHDFKSFTFCFFFSNFCFINKIFV